MSFTVVPSAFEASEPSDGEAAARVAIAAEGFTHLVVGDVGPGSLEIHFHDFPNAAAILAGELVLTDIETGIVHVCGPGTVIIDSGRSLHRESHGDYRVAVGYHVHPRQLELPIVRYPDGAPDAGERQMA
ncbi:MAG: hypothetical protein AB7V43_16640 [Acidimicrobiia bacterium]